MTSVRVGRFARLVFAVALCLVSFLAPSGTAGAVQSVSLGIRVSAGTINYGSSVTVAATLKDAAGHAVTGESIVFYVRRTGTTAWTRLGSKTTNSSGYISLAIKLAWNGQVTLRHYADTSYGYAASATAGVTVRPTLSLNVTLASAVLGSTSGVSGTLTPPHAGQLIYLQRYYSGAWHSLGSVKLSSTGGYRFAIRPATSGIYTYRVLKPADSDHVAVARQFLIKRYKATITTINYDAPGNDFNNVNGEYLVLKNTGAVGINLKGWTVYAGNSGQTFTLPSYGLAVGASVNMHTGSGVNGSGNLYLGHSTPIWNNNGDTGTVRDARGALVSTYTY